MDDPLTRSSSRTAIFSCALGVPTTSTRSSGRAKTTRSSAGPRPHPLRPYDAEEFVVAARPVGRRHPVLCVVDPAVRELLAAVDLQEVHAEQGPCVGFWVSASRAARGGAPTSRRHWRRWALDDLAPRHPLGCVPRERRAVAEWPRLSGSSMEGSSRPGPGATGIRRDAWVGSLLPSDLARTEAGRSVRVPRVEGWPIRPGRAAERRLLLRATRKGDAPALLAYAQDPVARSGTRKTPRSRRCRRACPSSDGLVFG